MNGNLKSTILTTIQRKRCINCKVFQKKNLKKFKISKLKHIMASIASKKKSKSLGGNGLKEPKKSHKSDIKLI
jgi:hypothetical protein